MTATHSLPPLRWTLTAAVLLLGLACWAAVGLMAQIEGERGVPPIASNSDFEVKGVKVNATGKTSEEARINGWRQAQRLGWAKLWRESKLRGDAPKLDDARLDAMVSAIVVESEQIGPRRYIATLGVLFDRARAGQLLGLGGPRRQSAPLLVIPIMWSGGSPQVFENRTPWQRAWARYRTADSAIDYVRPSGAGGESLLVNAGQAGRRDRIWWRLILDQFGAADVVMPVAEIERQWPGGPVKGTFIARFGPDSRELGRFTMEIGDSDELDAMLDRAIQRLDRIYTRALNLGQLTPDRSLIIETPADDTEEELEDGLSEGDTLETGPTTPAAGQITVSVQYETPDSGSVASGEGALRGIPGVVSANTQSLAIGGLSVMRVQFDGDIDALRLALQARGWEVTQGAGVLRIRRLPPAQ